MEQAATNLGYDQATKDSGRLRVGPRSRSARRPRRVVVASGSGLLARGRGGSGTPEWNAEERCRGDRASAGAQASQQFWKIDVPAGQTSAGVQTSAAEPATRICTVKSGSKPTLTSYDCRPVRQRQHETMHGDVARCDDVLGAAQRLRHVPPAYRSRARTPPAVVGRRHGAVEQRAGDRHLGCDRKRAVLEESRLLPA